MDYSTLSYKELIDICKTKKIKGYSNKTKSELISMIIKEHLESNQQSSNSSSSSSSNQDNINEEEIVNICKPILKWVGGKTQIISKIMSKFPKKINNYHEPFVGGGSVLIALLSYIQSNMIDVQGKIYASDNNKNLINLYKSIQQQPTGLLAEVNKIVEEYSRADGTTINRNPTSINEALSSPESYYYYIRSRFNQMTHATSSAQTQSSLEASAMFLFLNKTCFRGMYREGPNGYNVPFGNYKNNTIVDEEHLLYVSSLIQDVIFQCNSFTTSIATSNIEEGDFVYLDPPYAPETEKSFVGYTSDGFDLEQHTTLFEMCNNISKKNAKLLMSNSDVDLVRNSFTDTTTYTIEQIECRRAINSKNPESKTNELLIQNY